MAEISGLSDLKQRFETEAKTLSALDGSRQLVTNRLNESGVTVSTYGPYGSGFGEPSRRVPRSSLAQVADFRSRLIQIGEILTYATARMASAAFVPEENPAGQIADNISGYLSGPEGRLVRRVERHAGLAWDAPNVLEILDFNRYMSDIRVGDTGPVAHFLHFTHTHFPIDFDKDCNYRSDDKDWYEANQNRAGLKSQTECALSEFLTFLDQLKAVGVYDNSLVVFKSDHGEPVRYNDPDRLESFKIRDHINWGIGRYIPFLAVKMPGHHSDEPTFDQRPVALNDLALSICTAMLKDISGCKDFGGYNIFDPQTDIPDKAMFGLEIVKSKKSDFRMDSHEYLEVSRWPGILQSLNESLTSEILSVEPACGARIDLNTGAPLNNGQTDRERWVTWRDGRAIYVKTKRPHCPFSHIAVEMAAGTTVKDVTVDGAPASFELTGESKGTLLIELPKDLGTHPYLELSIVGERAQGNAIATALTFINGAF